ncbi:MAG: hypothetical protein K6F86_00025, partial [Lachnospiraceae bacterium]|nr:hypothetical protein [Lachnospiraceae bacterium]
MTEATDTYKQLSIFDIIKDPDDTMKDLSSNEIGDAIKRLEALQKIRKCLEEEDRRKEEENRRREEEERKRQAEEEARLAREMHIEEVTSMDLDLDWENI